MNASLGIRPLLFFIQLVRRRSIPVTYQCPRQRFLFKQYLKINPLTCFCGIGILLGYNFQGHSGVNVKGIIYLIASLNERLDTSLIEFAAPFLGIALLLPPGDDIIQSVFFEIEQQNRVTQLITPNIRLAVNPRLQLIGFYQKNTAVQRDVWNVRLAWEFQPLSFLYVVYNSNAQQQVNNTLQRTDLNRTEQFIGKLTYLKQF